MDQTTKTIQDKLQQVTNLLLIALAFILPGFFLPFTQDWYETNKQVLFLSGVLVGMVLWGMRMVTLGEIRIVRSRLGLPLLMLSLATIFSLLLAPSRFVSLVSLSTWVLIASPFLYLVYLNTPTSLRDIQKIVVAFLLGSSLLSILTLFYQAIEIGLVTSPSFFPSIKLTPAGSIINLNAVQIITIILAGLLAYYEKKGFKKVLCVGVTALALLTLLLSNPWAAPQKPLLLGWTESWNVAVGSFKSNPLTGAGPGKYAESFQRFKPLAYNSTENWTIVFGSALNAPLQILTELGLVGTVAFVFLLVVSFFLLKEIFLTLIPTKNPNENSEENPRENTPADIWLKTLTGGFAGALFVFIFFPLTTTSIFLFVAATALMEKLRFLLKPETSQEVQIWVLALPVPSINNYNGEQTSFEQGRLIPDNSPSKTTLAKFVFGVICTLTVFFVYAFSRSYAAEIKYQESLKAAAASKGTQTYDLQQKAINFNPLEARFHIAYANTNMGIANALASSRKEGLTEEDSKNIGQLINQAVREARRAITLAPNNSIYWENLGNIYRDLRGVAGGSEQWALTSYTQAINLNPYNPRLRIAIGGIYYGMKDWDNAISAFTDSAKLKPDFANAYYNLAWAYRQKGDYIRAFQAMQKTVELTSNDAESSLKAQAEMEEFQRLATEQQQQMAQQAGQDVLGEQIQPEATPSAQPQIIPGEEEPFNQPLPEPQEETSPTPAVSVGD